MSKLLSSHKSKEIPSENSDGGHSIGNMKHLSAIRIMLDIPTSTPTKYRSLIYHHNKAAPGWGISNHEKNHWEKNII